MSNFIFGRHDSDRHDVYFSALNQFQTTLNQNYNRLARDCKTLHNQDQESEDFEDDIMNAVKDVEIARFKLAEKIRNHRRAMGW